MRMVVHTLVAAAILTCPFMAAGGSEVAGKTWKIGDKGPGGGWVFYDKGNDTGGWRYLEAAPVDQGTQAAFGGDGTIALQCPAAGIGSGSANTRIIVNALKTGTYSAMLCAGYRGGGKSDWFLPSRDELNLMYVNLKAKGIGRFKNVEYWSSSEASEAYAWYQGFADGAQDNNTKTNPYHVRAARAFK